MVLGLPTEVFIHEVLRIVAFAGLLAVCVPRWQRGHWARLGAVAGGIGTALYVYYLLSWALFTELDVRALLDLREEPLIGDLLTWLDLVVLVLLVLAVVADRPGFDRRPRR